MEQQELIRQIQERNARVELDKAWETSFTRRVFIMAITYLTAAVFLRSIGNELFALNALVPTAGYLLSTLSLAPLKRWWMAKRRL